MSCFGRGAENHKSGSGGTEASVVNRGLGSCQDLVLALTRPCAIYMTRPCATYIYIYIYIYIYQSVAHTLVVKKCPIAVLMDPLDFVNQVLEKHLYPLEMNRRKEIDAVLQGLQLASQTFSSFTFSGEQCDDHRSRSREQRHDYDHRDDHRRRVLHT